MCKGVQISVFFAKVKYPVLQISNFWKSWT